MIVISLVLVAISLLLLVIWGRLGCIQKKLERQAFLLEKIQRDAAAVNFLHEQLSTIIAKIAESKKPQQAFSPDSE